MLMKLNKDSCFKVIPKKFGSYICHHNPKAVLKPFFTMTAKRKV